MSVQITKIADCADLLPGYALKARAEHEPEGTHQVILGKHLSEGSPYRYTLEHELRITLKGPVDRYRVSAGDVLFASRGSRNYAAMVASVPDVTVASAMFYILRPNDDIDSGYLAWCLNQVPIQAQIGQVRTGAGTPIVQRSVFADITIPIPSLDKQQQIAALGDLMAQEQHIRKNLMEETNKLHRALGQQLLHDMRLTAISATPAVIPAKAGIQTPSDIDSRLRGNDA